MDRKIRQLEKLIDLQTKESEAYENRKAASGGEPAAAGCSQAAASVEVKGKQDKKSCWSCVGCSFSKNFEYRQSCFKCDLPRSCPPGLAASAPSKSEVKGCSPPAVAGGPGTAAAMQVHQFAAEPTPEEVAGQLEATIRVLKSLDNAVTRQAVADYQEKLAKVRAQIKGARPAQQRLRAAVSRLEAATAENEAAAARRDKAVAEAEEARKAWQDTNENVARIRQELQEVQLEVLADQAALTPMGAVAQLAVRAVGQLAHGLDEAKRSSWAWSWNF